MDTTSTTTGDRAYGLTWELLPGQQGNGSAWSLRGWLPASDALLCLIARGVTAALCERVIGVPLRDVVASTVRTELVTVHVVDVDEWSLRIMEGETRSVVAVYRGASEVPPPPSERTVVPLPPSWVERAVSRAIGEVRQVVDGRAEARGARRLLELEDSWRALVRKWREAEGGEAQGYRVAAVHIEICADDLRAVREAQSALGETS